MRLVCPNCDAKYEVPDDAIPDTGRDVQCASCGHAWFQMRPRPAASAEVAPVAAPVAEPAPVPEVVVPVAEVVAEPESVVAEPEPAVEEVAATEIVEDVAAEPVVEAVTEEIVEGPASSFVPVDLPSDAELAPAVEALTDVVEAAPEATDAPTAIEEFEDEDEPESVPVAAAGAAAYAVDESVLAILREEAERETTARRAEARPLESQTELGIDAAMTPTQKRAAMLKVEEAKPAARRDLLPDVEEINSTLRPSEQPVLEEDEVVETPAPVREPRSGFRSGFLLVMTAAIIAAGLYIASPVLAGLVPGLAEPLTSYVNAIDSMRLQLDGLMRSATVAINGG